MSTRGPSTTSNKSVQGKAKVAFFASVLLRVTSILSNLVMLPILFRSLGSEELGAWLLISQMTAITTLFDFGLTPTLSRQFTLSRNHQQEGPLSHPLTWSDDSKNLYCTGRRLLQAAAVLVSTLAFSVGAGLFFFMPLETLSFKTILVAHGIVCVSQGLKTLFSFWEAQLVGMGRVVTAVLTGTFGQLLITVATTTAAFLGGGLVAMALATLAAGLVGRLAYQIALFRDSDSVSSGREGVFCHQQARSIMRPAIRSWITTVGMWMVQFTDQYFVSLLFGTASLPPYRACSLVVQNATMLAAMTGTSSVPFVSQLWAKGRVQEIRELLNSNLISGLSILATVLVPLLLWGSGFFDLWLGKGNFAGHAVFLLLAAVAVVRSIISILSETTRATEYERFAKITLAAGISNIVLSYLLGSALGIEGVVLATLIVYSGVLLPSHIRSALARLKYADSKSFAYQPIIFLLLTTVVLTVSLLLVDDQSRLAASVVGALCFGSFSVYQNRLAISLNWRRCNPWSV